MARKFIYDNGEEKLGPVTGLELLRLRSEGEIDDNTWVRPADSRTWRPLRHTNLRDEKEKEAKRGLWQVLFRRMSFKMMLVLGLVVVVLLAMLVVVGVYLWPLFLILFMIWLLSRLIQR